LLSLFDLAGAGSLRKQIFMDLRAAFSLIVGITNNQDRIAFNWRSLLTPSSFIKVIDDFRKIKDSIVPHPQIT